jgi:hypothetical protein
MSILQRVVLQFVCPMAAAVRECGVAGSLLDRRVSAGGRDAMAPHARCGSSEFKTRALPTKSLDSPAAIRFRRPARERMRTAA